MTTPILIAILSGLVLLALGAYAVFQTLSRDRKSNQNKARRLSIKSTNLAQASAKQDAVAEEQNPATAETQIAKHALDLATGGNKEKIARLRKMMVRAGEFDPAAPASFVLQRFIMMGVAFVLAVGYAFFSQMSLLTVNAMWMIVVVSIIGYFVPSILLMQKTKKRVTEYRNGFPDFMDLMIVCADAGLSLEASIERVSRELAFTYPSLSHNLTTFSLELRAGRNIHDAMQSFGDRVGLEEVDAFAVLLKQSKELGTSLSSTLRVFSEEMRDKRMMIAEEKAHALPAKMTIPVTVCILPTVVMIAIIPVIVKLGGE